MKYKSMSIIILTIFVLMSIAGVSASDADDIAIAGDDAGEIELSQISDIETSGQDTPLEQANDDEIISEQDDGKFQELPDKLSSVGEGSYSDLRDEIGSGGDINLTKSQYRYVAGDGDTIEIRNSGVINGNGAIIDMAGSNIRAFLVNASDVTIKNLTIKNANYTEEGGAIFFTMSGTVTGCSFVNNVAFEGGAVGFYDDGTVINCCFVNNTASDEGGAIWFYDDGAVINCCFVNNTASDDGGAIWFYDDGAVINCSFVNNTASDDGGAICFYDDGTVINCSFVNNHASCGGAMYIWDDGRVKNCNFNNNKVVSNGGAIYQGHSNHMCTVSDCNFVNNHASCGGAICIYESSYIENCSFVNNTASDDGGAIHSGVGYVVNCSFVNNTASDDGGAIYSGEGYVVNCSFVDCSVNSVNEGSEGGAVYISDEGSVINCSFVDCFANASKYVGGGAVYILYVGCVVNCSFVNCSVNCDNDGEGGAVYISDEGSVINCSFVDCFANAIKYVEGGAVHISDEGYVVNCSFVNCSVNCDNDGKGGAVHISDEGSVINCSFVNCSANSLNDSGGGAIYIYYGNITNCNFTANKAGEGSAIYFSFLGTKIISNSRFLNNRANADEDSPFEVVQNENNIEITFIGGNNLLNAIYSADDVSITNVSYWGADGITNTGSSTIVLSPSPNEAGQNITVIMIIDDIVVVNQTNVTDSNGKIVIDRGVSGNYLIVVSHDEDSYYTQAKVAITNIPYYVNVTSQATNNRTVNITAKSNIRNEIIQEKLTFVLSNGDEIIANYDADGTWWAIYTFDDFGDYNVTASYDILEDLTINNATISIRDYVPINVGNVTISFDEVAEVVVSVPEAINGQNITISVNETSKNATVENGEAKASFADLDAGEYIITVVYLGDDYDSANSTSARLTVNKTDSTLSVKSIAFDYGSTGSAEASYTGATGINATVVNQPNAAVNVKGNMISVSNLDVGSYTLSVTTIADGNHNPVTENVTVTVNRIKTEFAADAITATYNVNKDLVITLKDVNGKPLSGVKVTVDLNGAREYITDNNGQIKVSTNGLLPKTYVARIAFTGSAIYKESSADVNVVVKKATPKIIAKKKTYNAKAKTKKFTITLKDNTGKPIKKAKVRLIVKKITKKAKKNKTTKKKKKKNIVKTNSKGKATFKVDRSKKGNYWAIVKFAGNKYYTAATKKVKITIK